MDRSRRRLSGLVLHAVPTLFALSLFPAFGAAQALGPVRWSESPSLPPAYYERLQEYPGFSRVERGWVHRTQQEILRGSPLSGNLPVVLVQGLFADSPEPHVTQQDLQESLFDGPSPYGTLTEYYDEVSGGRLSVTGTSLPWVRTSLTMAETVGDSYGLGSGSRTGEYLFEIMAAVDEGFDFGAFDNDGPDGIPNSGDDDGFVDAVAFQFLEVSASCGGPAIWPHRWVLRGWNDGEPFVTDDPKQGGGFINVDDYTIQSAVDCGGMEVQKATTIAHELGHVLGLPDLYDSSQGIEPENRRWVVGCWDLMAAGAWGCGTSNREDWFRPTHMGAWDKIKLGWVGGLEDVPPVLGQEFVLDPVQEGEQVLRIPLEPGLPGGEGEHLLIEYRTQEGFDQDLPASGVLVYHVDPKISGNRPCDTCPQNYSVELLEADGDNTLRLNFGQGGNRGEAGDAWGTFGPGKLSSSTYPSTRLTSGAESPVTIYEITLSDGVARILLSSTAVPRSRLGQAFLGGGGQGVTPEEVAYLDGKGNQNGQYDVGDLRAYLKR